MACIVETIRWSSQVIWDVLHDSIIERTNEEKLKLIEEYIQHTRERCHVIQAELADWRAALARWEEEKG